jgi:hypothetical protein
MVAKHKEHSTIKRPLATAAICLVALTGAAHSAKATGYINYCAELSAPTKSAMVSALSYKAYDIVRDEVEKLVNTPTDDNVGVLAVHIAVAVETVTKTKTEINPDQAKPASREILALVVDRNAVGDGLRMLAALEIGLEMQPKLIGALEPVVDAALTACNIKCGRPPRMGSSLGLTKIRPDDLRRVGGGHG